MNELIHKDLTDKILKCFYEVYNNLGYGFLERGYQNSMTFELRRNELSCLTQRSINVFYKSDLVGRYCADIIVENLILLELKACEVLRVEHEFQLINYLRATDIEVGLLLNFGKKPEFKRKLFTNELKKLRKN